jgi:hypothetical protein
MKSAKRHIQNSKKVAVSNLPQSVRYQRVTQSVSATGKFKPIHYVLMAFSVLIVSQLIKMLVYLLFFPGNESPEGLTLLLLIYAQYVLFAVFFVLLVMAIIQALRQAIKEF